MRLHRFSLVIALVGLTSTLAAQEPTWGVGTWPADSFGNQRAVVRVHGPADAVWAHLPWRRRDLEPERKEILVVDAATGQRVTDLARVFIHRELGDLVFRPPTVPGDYYIYFLPYTGTVRSNYPKIQYPAPTETADSAWLRRHDLMPARAAAARLNRFPQAELVEFQAVDSFNSMSPMELIATGAEVNRLLGTHPGAGYLVFPEDRRYPVRMSDDIPWRWAARGAGGPFVGEAQRGEFYVFQLGVWAARTALDSVRVSFSALAGPARSIAAEAFRCINQEGVDWRGRAFASRVTVDSGRVQALWCGVQVPENAPAGPYRATATVHASGWPATDVALQLTVADKVIPHAGDDEPWRLARLRWLDSRLAEDDGLVPPYTPMRVRGDTVALLGRELVLGADGLPRQIRSFFAPEMTHQSAEGRELLAEPVRLVAQDGAGRPLAWSGRGHRIASQSDGAVVWEAHNTAGPLTMDLSARAEFDGHVQFTVAIGATAETDLTDIRLEIPLRPDVARYMMGLGRKGGYRPDRFDWQWDVKHNHDAAWVGDVNAGLQFSLRDEHYRRPLNTNFYLQQPLVMPASWDNHGHGGCRLRSEASAYRIVCFSGPRRMQPGETQRYDFILLLTPFKVLDTAGQWATRYFHAFAPLDSVAGMGANTVNVHHATAVNPWINYPFLAPDTLRAYVRDAHARGIKVKLYYTVRELTNHAPELFPLRSLGHEIFTPGPGGGFSWLQEHLGSDYLAGWHVPAIRDAAIINTGISRWHNFYVEGLNWLVQHIGIDGLYIDDVAFDRSVMQRVRRVLDRGRPGALIDLHSANQFNERDGFVNSANLYLEHFPYINRLWFGEYFDYDAPPDYWLVEVSGIPYGLMGEMLEKGGNPWRGMLYGMTNRLPWSGDPRPLWQEWDRFGIQHSAMIGYWVPDAPVRTGREDVLATAYVREGKTLVALASWARDTVLADLAVDWSRLGLDPARSVVRAPAIEGFQPAAVFRPGVPIPVAPGRGWLLELTPRQ